MWAFLLSTIGRWVIGGVLIAGILGGGVWYVKRLQSSRDAWKRVAIEQRRVIEIYEKDQATDRATEEKKHEVDEATTPEQLDRFYDELRRRATGKGRKPAKAGDKRPIPAPAEKDGSGDTEAGD